MSLEREQSISVSGWTEAWLLGISTVKWKDVFLRQAGFGVVIISHNSHKFLFFPQKPFLRPHQWVPISEPQFCCGWHLPGFWVVGILLKTCFPKLTCGPPLSGPVPSKCLQLAGGRSAAGRTMSRRELAVIRFALW